MKIKYLWHKWFSKGKSLWHKWFSKTLNDLNNAAVCNQPEQLRSSISVTGARSHHPAEIGCCDTELWDALAVCQQASRPLRLSGPHIVPSPSIASLSRGATLV
eukprot:COSAG01_NODE_581_length_15195_cov_16.315291_16_plen_103_part_00